MRIITKRPIEYTSEACGCSNADAAAIDPTGRDSSGIGKRKKAGYFSKERRESRQEKRSERRAARRAKRGARPLKAFLDKGKKFFHDKLHPVKKKADGTYEKTLADGTTVPVDPKNLAQLDASKFPGLKVGGDGKLLFDKLDLGGRKPTAIAGDDGLARVATIIQEKAAVAIPGSNGEVEYYKEEDTEENDGSEPSEAGDGKGLSTGAKLGIGIGAAVALGAIIYFATRKKG